MRISAIIFTATLLLSSYKIVGSSKQQWKRSTTTAISPLFPHKVINPIYNPLKDSQPNLKIFYTIPTEAEYVSKEQFDNYKKSHDNLIKRITYSDEGQKVVYAWEAAPHF